MNNVKSAQRNSLRQDTLDALLRVQSTAHSTSKFDPTAAILKWMECGPGTRHLGGHKRPEPKIPSDMECVEVPEDDRDGEANREH